MSKKVNFTAKDMLDSDNNNMPVLFINREIARYRDDWIEVLPHKFPEQSVILRAAPCGRNHVYLYYIEPKMKVEMYAVTPNDFLLKRLTGEEAAKEMKNTHEEFIKNNMATQLRHGFYIGCDPEIFVENDKGIIPAFKFLNGKDNPHTSNNGVNKAYWDGFQAEFTTTASSCLAYQVDYIQSGLRTIYSLAKGYDKDARLSLRTVMDIPPQMLAEAEEKHVQFGCMPSFNAYDMKGEISDGRSTPFRPAGGHIHFGIGKTTKAEANKIVKGLDAIIGVACVSLFAKFDDPRRRQLYGLAGEYRLPAHGLEYRVLSNAWLVHPLIAHLVFDVARKALMFARNEFMEKYWIADEKEVIETINTCNVEKARKMLKQNKDMFLNILKAAYGGTNAQMEVLYNAFMNGMESVILNPNDFVKNWSLDSTWTGHSGGSNKCVSSALKNITEGKKVA